MKKSNSILRLKHPIFDSKNEYYKQIGEEAAVNTFTKGKFRHKLQTISPPNKLSSSKEDLWNTERNLKFCQSPNSRDVSHIRDKLKKPPHAIPLISDLPLDLKTLKKLINSSDKFGIPQNNGVSITSPCRKEACLNTISKQKFEFAEFDTNSLGHPSGRQDSENLKKWIKMMKAIHCKGENTNENAELIYLWASKEIVRQVAVHCIEKGEVLQEIIEFMYGKSVEAREKIGKFDEVIGKVRENVIGEWKEKEKALSEKIRILEESAEVFRMRIRQRDAIIEELNEKLKFDKEEIEDLLARCESDDDDNLKVQFTYRTNSGVCKSPRFPKVKRSKIGEIAVQTDASFYVNFEKASKLSGTEREELEIYRGGFGIEILSQNYFVQFTNGLQELETQESPVFTVSPDVLQSSEPERVKNLEKNLGKGKKKKRKPTKPAKTARKGKFKKTLPISDLSLLEKDEKIKELSLIIEEQSYQISILKSIDEGRRQSILPTITINEPLKELNPNFDLLSFQSGYQSGFSNGYDLGLDTISNGKAEQESLSISNSAYWADEDQNESFQHDSGLHKSNSDVTEQGSFCKKLENAIVNSENHPTQRKSIMAKGKTHIFLENPLSTLQRKSKIAKGNTNFFMENPSQQNLNIGLPQIIGYLFHQKFHKNDKHDFPESILHKLLNKRISWIKAKANMSKKMINKLMSNLYMSYYLRSDFSIPLLYFIYDEFLQKSGLKKAGEKKFIQFISSLISRNSRRAQVFLRFILAGKVIKKADFSQFSLKFYLECWNFMQSARFGIAYFDDTLDEIMLPLIRGIECIKEKFDEIDKGTAGKLIFIIEKEAAVDPKKLNPGGLIENEVLLENMVLRYEEYQENIVKGVELVVKSIKFHEDQSVISRNEVYIIIRIMYPLKLEEFEKVFKDGEVKIEDFCTFCIEKSIFAIVEIKNFFEDGEKTLEEIGEIVIEGVIELTSLLSNLKNNEKIQKSLGFDTWQAKLQALESNYSRRDPYESLLALSIYKNELLRLNLT